jgi:hypothetical protein
MLQQVDHGTTIEKEKKVMFVLKFHLFLTPHKWIDSMQRFLVQLNVLSNPQKTGLMGLVGKL